MKQLVQPNLNTVGTLGYCLVYVRDVFSAPWAGTDAWTSWNSYTKLKHADWNIPSGVYVPIWFDGYWNGQRLGHTAVYKDGKVWSSPYKQGATNAVLSSIAEVERIYGMKYVGWSEDIGGKQVIKKGTDMIEKDNFAQLRVVNSEVKGWDINQTHAGAFDAREIGAWAGQPWVKFIQQAWEEGEAYRTQKALWQSFYYQYKDIVGELSKRPTTAELQAVLKKLAEAEKQAQAAAEEAAKLKLEQTEDTQLLNEGGSFLQKLFNRLFKKG